MTLPKLRALVVEDEWPARNYLVELLEGSGLAEVVGAVETVAEAEQALGARGRDLAIDVAFVDVQLGGGAAGAGAGLRFVRAHAEARGAPAFVLATAFSEHALEAYALGVVDYLVKPFTEERIEQCLRRIRARLGAVPAPEPAAPSRIVARKKRSLVFLSPADVWAFEAEDRLTYVHTAQGRFDLDLSLSSIEASFGRALLRVHRNWLVNAEHVKELSLDAAERTLFVGASLSPPVGVQAPVARERAQAVREALLVDAAGLKKG